MGDAAWGGEEGTVGDDAGEELAAGDRCFEGLDVA